MVKQLLVVPLVLAVALRGAAAAEPAKASAATVVELSHSPYLALSHGAQILVGHVRSKAAGTSPVAAAEVGTLTFAVDQADIQSQFYGPLDRVADTLRQYPQTVIDVVGHADATGADDYNQALSERRAASVASYLVNRGVLRDRLFVAGRGESQPIASNATDSGRAANRRVEIKIVPVTQDDVARARGQ